MKIIIFILSNIITLNLNSQSFDKILTIRDSGNININGKFLIKEIVIKGVSNLSSYELLVQQAKDSTILFNGNCVEIINYQPIEIYKLKIKNDALIAKIYKLENSVIDSLSGIINQKKSKKSFWKKVGNKILDHTAKSQYYALQGSRRRHQQFRDFFSISEEDNHETFTYGYSLGLDYFIFLNGSITADYFFFNRKSFRMSINNRLGAMLQLNILMIYDYPSIKAQTKVSNIWITSSVGQEYLRIVAQYQETENHTIDLRFDFGIKWITHSGTEIEISMPLRIDDGAIIPVTGINVNFAKNLY